MVGYHGISSALFEELGRPDTPRREPQLQIMEVPAPGECVGSQVQETLRVKRSPGRKERSQHFAGVHRHAYFRVHGGADARPEANHAPCLLSA